MLTVLSQPRHHPAQCAMRGRDTAQACALSTEFRLPYRSFVVVRTGCRPDTCVRPCGNVCCMCLCHVGETAIVTGLRMDCALRVRGARGVVW